MWKRKNKLTHYTTNELLRIDDIPLYPASEEDEPKITYFRAFWQCLSPTEIYNAISIQIVSTSQAKAG